MTVTIRVINHVHPLRDSRAVLAKPKDLYTTLVLVSTFNKPTSLAKWAAIIPTGKLASSKYMEKLTKVIKNSTTNEQCNI